MSKSLRSAEGEGRTWLSPRQPPAPSTPLHLSLLVKQLSKPSHSVVAFLGAGFLGHMGAQFSSWSFLLRGIVKETQPQAVREELTRQLDKGGASDAVFQRVAQLAEDNLGEARLHDVAARLLTLPAAVYSEEACNDLPLAEAAGVFQFRKRLALLRLLPFRAILTTNFTTFGDCSRVVNLPQPEGGAEAALRELLRGAPRHARMDETWLNHQEKLLRCLNDDGRTPPPPWSDEDPLIIHLHGTCVNPVVTKLGYRALLHRSPAYLPFMRTLMTTNTLVYIGFSFSDAYLDEIRSESLSMLSSMTRQSGYSAGGEGASGGSASAEAAALPSLKRPRDSFSGGASGSGGSGGSGSGSSLGGSISGAGGSALSAAPTPPPLPEPLGFALMPIPPGVEGDASVTTLLDYHRRHEGMAWLAYAVPEGTHDHSACDGLLALLIRQVCVPFKLAEALRKQRLLVFDKVREGFAEKCVPLLSKLVLSTVDASKRDELIAKYNVALAAQEKYIRRYDATKLLQAAEDKDSFLPPERPPEEWPLADGGKIEVIFLSRALLKDRLRDADLPATFGQPAPPTYDEEGTSIKDIGELTMAEASCGQRRCLLPSGKLVELPHPPDAEPAAPRTFAALITLSGYRGSRPSMYMNTLAMVRALPLSQQMPVLVFGRAPVLSGAGDEGGLDEARLQCYDAQARSLGAVSWAASRGSTATRTAHSPPASLPSPPYPYTHIPHHLCPLPSVLVRGKRGRGDHVALLCARRAENRLACAVYFNLNLQPRKVDYLWH